MKEKIEGNTGKSSRQVSRRKMLKGVALVAGSTLSASSAIARVTSQPTTTTLNITGKQATLSPAGVVINDTNLANAVRTDRARTVTSLQKTIPTLRTEEISIDSSGRVVIRNAEFRTRVQSVSPAALKSWCFIKGNTVNNCKPPT